MGYASACHIAGCVCIFENTYRIVSNIRNSFFALCKSTRNKYYYCPSDVVCAVNHDVMISMYAIDVLSECCRKLSRSCGSYTEVEVAAIMTTVLEVLSHCHSMSVIYRDVKPVSGTAPASYTC